MLSERWHPLRAAIFPSGRRLRCQVSAVLTALSAMLAFCLLLLLATVFIPIDRNVNGQEFFIKRTGVIDEGSRSITSGLDARAPEADKFGAGARDGARARDGDGLEAGLRGADFDLASVTLETGNRMGEIVKLSNGMDRCFFDHDGCHRCYPTVFFFGTSKCATTSLARWLDEHPATHWVANPRRPHQIEQTGVKEAHVFDDPPKGNRMEEQILLNEKLFITSPKVSPDGVVIDYTPHYLASSEAPHRIANMYGQESGLKFIVTLREPASRAISSWEFKNEFNPKKKRNNDTNQDQFYNTSRKCVKLEDIGQGREEKRTLQKTVRDGIKRGMKLLACVELAKEKHISNRERDLLHCNPRKFLEMPLYVSHVGKSMYSVQLERWFNLFGRENVKVVFTDDMAIDPMGVLEDVLDFLGLDFTDEDKSKGLPDLDRWRKITGMSYNKTKSKKKDELANQVTDELKAELRRFFEPQNRELEKLLGCPVPSAWN